MAGADGIIYETHKTPDKAYSDAQQTISFDDSEKMIERLRKTWKLRNSF